MTFFAYFPNKWGPATTTLYTRYAAGIRAAQNTLDTIEPMLVCGADTNPRLFNRSAIETLHNPCPHKPEAQTIIVAHGHGFRHFMQTVPQMQREGMPLPSLVLIDPVTILSVEADDSLPIPVFPHVHAITVKTPLQDIPVNAALLSHEYAPVRSHQQALTQALITLATNKPSRVLGLKREGEQPRNG